jgi:hypothetical protein
VEDVTPPPPAPPRDTQHLPSGVPHRRLKTRGIIIGLGILLAVAVVVVAIMAYRAHPIFTDNRPSPTSTPAASDYVFWLNQETQKWQDQGFQISTSTISDDHRVISLTTVNVVAASAKDLCDGVVRDFVVHFHHSVTVELLEANNNYAYMFCTALVS